MTFFGCLLVGSFLFPSGNGATLFARSKSPKIQKQVDLLKYIRIFYQWVTGMNLPLLDVLSQGQEKPSCFSNPDFFSCSYGHYCLSGAQVQSSFAF